LRYLKNNFFDGARQVWILFIFLPRMLEWVFSIVQDSFDLVTGTWVPRKNPSSSLFLIGDPRPLIIRSVSKFPWLSWLWINKLFRCLLWLRFRSSWSVLVLRFLALQVSLSTRESWHETLIWTPN
jgi:hypothetical protein